MSLLALSPSLSSLAHVLAASADGRVALVVRRGLLYLTSAAASRSLMLAANVVAAAMVDAAAWVVTADARGHTLHRFSAEGRPQGPAIFLGELGEEVTVTASPSSAAAPLVVIEGRRGVLVRALGEDVEVEELRRTEPARRPRPITVEEAIVEGAIEGAVAEEAIAGSFGSAIVGSGSFGEETGQVSLAAIEAAIEEAIEAQAAELFAALLADQERARLELVGSCQ